VAKDGAKVVAVCDSKCGLYNESGIYVSGILKHKQETGSLRGFSGAKEIASDDVLEVDCDILCPSALENSITLSNLANVKGKSIAELANSPTTPSTHRVLENKHLLYIPQ